MSKKMKYRKKGLAVIFCIMMGITAIAGCGKEEETPVVEADEDALEIPEVKGKEDTVGAFTLLVPKGMDAEEGSSESVVTLSEDDDAGIVFQVVEKSDAKDYVKALMEEDDSYKEITFNLDGTKWTGASHKKDFVVYAKIGKSTVIAIGSGYKYTDDIPLAVLASLEVESGAETVAIGGASGKGGTFVYGDGLFTVEYTGAYREADPSCEFGSLVSADGTQRIYVESFATWDEYLYELDDIYSYNYDSENIYLDGWTGTLYTYYDEYWDEYRADFIIPLEYIYANHYGEMVAVYIHTEADTEEAAVTEDFLELIGGVEIDAFNCTDEPCEPVYETDSYEGGIGDVMETAWFDFTITDAYCCDSYMDYSTWNDGDFFVAVRFEITNTFNQPIELWYEELPLRWGDYEDNNNKVPGLYVSAEDNLPIYFDLDAGETIDGWYVYEVPGRYSDFYIVFVEEYVDGTIGDSFRVDFTPEKID